jgi:hypothetical protein
MAALKFSDISGRLSPEARSRCLKLAGKSPARGRRRARAGVASSPPASSAIAPGAADWTLRRCERCCSEIYGPPGLDCPVECGEWLEAWGKERARFWMEQEGKGERFGL